MQAVKPRPKSLQNRFFFLETKLFPFFIITRITFVDVIFDPEQTVTILDALYCRLTVIKLFALWYRINEVSSDVCPAGTAFDTRYLIITLITVTFQISLEAFKELCGMVTVSGRCVIIQDDRRLAIFTAPEQLYMTAK